jgi:ATP-dependent Clp protease ATP-binding subunit ClpA
MTGEGAGAGQFGRIAVNAMRRRFSPEFVNRIDRAVTYRPLGGDAFERILDIQLDALQTLISKRFAEDAFTVRLTPAAREFLLTLGTSAEYGARELKRVIHRHLIQPLAQVVLLDLVEPGGVVKFDLSPEGDRLRALSRGGRPLAA